MIGLGCWCYGAEAQSKSCTIEWCYAVQEICYSNLVFGHRLNFVCSTFDTEFSGRTTQEDWQRTVETRSQPNFVNSVLNYHAHLALRTDGNKILNKISAEAQRYALLAYTLYLHDTRDPKDPRSGLTSTNLEKLCAKQKCASPGRVRTYIGLMWIAGYLKRFQSPQDSRKIHFEPTKKLIDNIEAWNQEIFKTIDLIFPGGALATRHLNEPFFGSQMRIGGVAQCLSGLRPFDQFPEVYHFISRDAGWMLLINCVGQTMRAPKENLTVSVSIDLAGFGKRYGVSRSHLRRLLESSFALGLLEEPPLNGTNIVLSRKLVAAYFTSMAAELQFYRRNALTGNAKIALAAE